MPTEDCIDVPVLKPDETEDSKDESRNKIKQPPKLKCLLELDYLLDEERENIVFKQKVTRVLNKITRKSFHKFVKLFEKLLSDNPERHGVAFYMLVDRAINDPLFYPIYANLACTICYSLKGSKKEEKLHKIKIFRFMFSEKMLELFSEIPNLRPLNDNEIEAELLGTMPLEKRKRMNRLKSIGVCRIIGELFKIGTINKEKLGICIDQLFHHKEEDIFLECLYVLFTSVGKHFQVISDWEMLDEYFDVLEDIVQNEDLVISNRIRILLLNLLDLKRRSWV